MTIDHIAIWTDNLEILKEYYLKYFMGTASNKYVNDITGFSSYFISFKSGTRLEIMSKPGIPDNMNDTVMAQHKGIIHIAFGADTMVEVVLKAEQLRAEGYKIVSGPRKTGDGYYEFETLDPDNNRLEVTTKYYE
jgi:lactoylglutathione lyase